MTDRKLQLLKDRPSPLAKLVDAYLANCRAAGLSPKTIRFSYGYPLREVFLPWAAAEGFTEVGQPTSRDMDRLSARLLDVGGRAGRPLSRHTVWTYMKSVRRFLAWAKEEGERVQAEAKLPKLPRKLVDVLSPKEVDRLEAVATSERDKVIVRILADGGLRRGELVTLTLKDLFERDGRWYLKVQGKGSRERHVPVTRELARRLRRYMAGRPAAADSDRLFLSRRLDPVTQSYLPITESAVTQLLGDLGARAGLGKRVTPHVLRHSAATTMLRRGMDSLLVAQVLGHASLRMVQQVYSHLAPDDLHSAMMAALRANDD